MNEEKQPRKKTTRKAAAQPAVPDIDGAGAPAGSRSAAPGSPSAPPGSPDARPGESEPRLAERTDVVASDERLDAGRSDGAVAEETRRRDADPIVHAAADAGQPAIFPIVGIGASAGGLAAFEAFFSAMPNDVESGMAFVLVQHLSPDHKNVLVDLIQRYTRMQVFEAEEGMRVLPNCTYIIPPGHDLSLIDGRLHLGRHDEHRQARLTIDHFFQSLAQRERAICIVMSGTGSDGTLGLREIKGEGGLAIAQAPETTDYDGMPRSAIATGMVDYVLPPSEMPAQLIAYVRHAFDPARKPAQPPHNGVLRKLCALLRAQTGHDFGQYKETTLVRRMSRRMALHQIEEPEAYVRYARQNPQEVEGLFRDLLIGVTNFFRDPGAFKVLEEKVIPRLIATKATHQAVRVWVCGCSTGEEAYSIAILLHEQAMKMRRVLKIQIFATDIDRQAIEQARIGLYPASIAGSMSDERLKRYFVHDPHQGSYRIQKYIRDLLVFSEQDVIKDPPFSKLDLISCRNLLIYLNSALQRKLIPLFHYALVPGGALFLGTSETAGESARLFDVVDRKWKLYFRSPPAPDEKAAALSGHEQTSRIAELEHELQAKDEYLQTTLEEMETTNEELKSTNEEMQSINEELQSTNEEVETSKEELQSVNEELSTVNAELQDKVIELSRANNDMNKLLAGTGVATVFVDHHLRIARFTPAATQVIHFIAGDVGRPLEHVATNLVGYDGLIADVRSVLETLAPKEAEVQVKGGAWYLMRIRPYRTMENTIEGAVITMVDISERRKAEDHLRRSEARLRAFIHQAPAGVSETDLEGRFLFANDWLCDTLGYSREELLRKRLEDITDPEDLPQVDKQYEALVAGSRADVQIDKRYITKNGSRVRVLERVSAIRDATGRANSLLAVGFVPPE